MSSHRNALKRSLIDTRDKSDESSPKMLKVMPAAGAASTGGIRGGWQSGLKVAMSDASQVLFSDSSCAIIADKYPKAKHHYLAMPTRQIESLSQLTRRDAALLRSMLAAAKKFVTDRNLGDVKFRYGFHAVPSMSQLHMHVISQDFVSPCLKNKKHWLSFSSKFFIDCEALISVFEQDGTGPNSLAPRVTLQGDGENCGLAIDSTWFSNLIKQGALKCNQCSRVCKTMPELKGHLMQHSL